MKLRFRSYDCSRAPELTCINLSVAGSGTYAIRFHLPKRLQSTGRALKNVDTLIEKQATSPLGLTVIGPNGMTIRA